MLKWVIIAVALVVLIYVLLAVDFSTVGTMSANPIRDIVELLFAMFDGVR